ncbi:hypothetical protein MKW98_027015 [Papaver atlanticum]|uniref:Uncharacterized protein n=1 Tax=Papaver atlanticum TaxID=357466 RepID=A0AAD4X556_9MAGN|nr:hypothetical protein MKW98_027015 [Papaver atlanticum]
MKLKTDMNHLTPQRMKNRRKIIRKNQRQTKKETTSEWKDLYDRLILGDDGSIFSSLVKSLLWLAMAQMSLQRIKPQIHGVGESQVLKS